MVSIILASRLSKSITKATSNFKETINERGIIIMIITVIYIIC